MIHLEGMGLLGSLLALQLERRDIPFTWNDTDQRSAWRASTGLVYPAGDDRSQQGLAGWQRWLTEPWLPPRVAAPCAYVYTHKHPPHGGRYQPVDLGDCRVAPAGSAVAVNVPALVRATRHRFAARAADRPASAPLVRSHGFNTLMGTVMWGWAVPVRLDVPERILDACHGLAPAFYSRLGRFQIAYAYPIVGTGKWWAGSSLIPQRTPHDLDPAPHFAAWARAWRQLWPAVSYTVAGDLVQGWRPRPRVEPDDAHLVVEVDGILTMPPLWHSGVRWAPVVIDQAITRLREAPLYSGPSEIQPLNLEAEHGSC